MTADNSVFQLKEGTGWTRGLSTLVRAEFGSWFRTRKWWSQILAWAAIINLILFLVAISQDNPEEFTKLFSIFMGLFAVVGVVVLMQNVIVGEKQEGTASWTLSKPVTRKAFVLAKLSAKPRQALETPTPSFGPTAQ